ncbi:uncharacterized protein BJ171DRAFT_504808 [Polychytrium aggregatum]|uniref:uncharacterized protein n=1 Tax=Polychytrium aggregatum TaxID=110093 RepID=UPI0022FE45D1|nr:uncharacterized protein BJ171DRAFT_504808 [Polychytrium aggregatum]KAI9204611.1 hypothetical protein BJ171DRAFT_504808 [Polychytrium aggregatum]
MFSMRRLGSMAGATNSICCDCPPHRRHGHNRTQYRSHVLDAYSTLQRAAHRIASRNTSPTHQITSHHITSHTMPRLTNWIQSPSAQSSHLGRDRRGWIWNNMLALDGALWRPNPNLADVCDWIDLVAARRQRRSATAVGNQHPAADSEESGVGGQCLATAISQPFTSYGWKQFPGMQREYPWMLNSLVSPNESLGASLQPGCWLLWLWLWLWFWLRLCTGCGAGALRRCR